MDEAPSVGLVLTGGGARGAYQAGVLRAIAQRLGPRRPSPFRVVTGVSAGAVNAAFVAAHADDFDMATRRLWELWASLRVSDVYETGPVELSRTGLRLAAELSLGAWVHGPRTNHLLDTRPLRRLLEAQLDLPSIARRLEDGTLGAVAVSATNYGTGTSVTFFDGAARLAPWVRTSRLSTRVELTPAHVLASAALPIFFPPVRIGNGYFGDGCIRNGTPLSAAIRLGADRLLAIGVRELSSPESTRWKNETAFLTDQPPLARIAGVLLNAVFLDSLETDVERARRINDTLGHIPLGERRALPLRRLPLMAIRPSRSLSTLGTDLLDSFSPPVQHLLRGLGASRDTGRDLMSFLAFDQSYTEPLLKLGLEDGLAHGGAVDELLSAA